VLQRAGIGCECRCVQSEAAVREALARFHPQIILSDFSLPGFDGLSALAIAREVAPDVAALRHPQQGLIIAGRLPAAAGVHRMTAAVGEWVVAQAARDRQHWQPPGVAACPSCLSIG
jgi:CheY-like chemotaxis protein